MAPMPRDTNTARCLYSISYAECRELRALASTHSERAAVMRLFDFKGDEQDVLTAAGIYSFRGRADDAARLLRLLGGAR